MNGGIFLALLARLWRQHWLPLLIVTLGIGVFEFVITQLAPLPGELGFFAGVAALLPKGLSSLVTDQLSLASPAGVIALGYLHPFFLSLLSAWVIRIGAGALAGEIGRGTMDMVASRPMARRAIVAAAAIAIASGLAIVLLVAWAITSIGLGTRPLGVSGVQLWRLPAMAWLLFMAWAGVTLAISASRREAGSVIAWASGLIATSVVLEFLSRMWQPLAWTRGLSLFAYYRPQDIVRAGIGPWDPLTLGLVAAIGLATAVALFQRRDL